MPAARRFPPPLCRGIGRLLCRDGQCRRVARTSYDVRLSLRVRGMRTNPKRILIFAFTAAVVMAMVPDARPQDADQGQIEFLLNCARCHGTDAKKRVIRELARSRQQTHFEARRCLLSIQSLELNFQFRHARVK